MRDDVKNGTIGQRVLSNTASNLAGKFLFLVSGFFLTPFILHRLGATQFGLWALAGSVVGYGSLLDFGIGPAIIKYIAELRVGKDWREVRILLATALRLYSLMAIVAMFLSIIVAPFFPRLFHVPAAQHFTAIWLVLLMGGGMAISIPCTVTTAILRGCQRYDVVSLLSSIGVLLYVAGTVLVLSTGGGLLQFVAVGIAVNVVMQAPAVWFIKKIAPEIELGWHGAGKTWVHRVLSLSWWVFVMDFSGRIQTRTDELVIGAFLPINYITPFTIARRLSEVGQIVTDQFLKTLMPLASELEAGNDIMQVRVLYLAATRVTLSIMAPIICMLSVFAGPLLTIWVGAPYARYSPLVVILGLASLFDISAWPAGSILQGIARPRPLAITAACAAVTNLLLSIILVRPFGLTGVAVGTLIPSFALSVGFFSPYMLRILHVRTKEFLTEVIVPAIAPVVPMLLLTYLVTQMLRTTSPFMIGVVGLLGMSVYLATYLNFSATHVERQTYRRFLVSALHQVEIRLKR